MLSCLIIHTCNDGFSFLPMNSDTLNAERRQRQVINTNDRVQKKYECLIKVMYRKWREWERKDLKIKILYFLKE